MNCQDFESVAFELARAQLIDAAARESATAHADSCGACAERLRREEALTDALRQVGAASRETCAPPRVEAALLAAFREGRVAALLLTVGTVETVRAEPVIPFNARPRAARRVFATAAVAASVLLALAAAWLVFASNSSSGNSQGGALVVKEMNQPVKVDVAPKEIETPAATVIDAKDVRESSAATHVARRAKRRRADAVESLPISFKVDGGQVTWGGGESAAAQTATQVTDASATADFVQLATGDSSAPLESGQMVRVQVPRAALAALGLPVNAERAGEMVKADILLAHDGTARAIRLRP